MSTTTVHTGAKARRAVQADERRGAIAKQMRATAHREKQTGPYAVAVKVGPLDGVNAVKVSKDDDPLTPGTKYSRDGLLDAAWRFLTIEAHHLPFLDSVNDAVYRDAKLQRNAAKSAVKTQHFKRHTGPDSEPVAFTARELAPLVTWLRKELARDVRERQRTRDRRDREQAREQARQERVEARERAKRQESDAKAKEQTLQQHMAKAGAVLPQGAKPSSSLVPKTSNSTVMQFCWVLKLSTGWHLVSTDAYQMAVVPLTVVDEKKAGLKDGMAIPREAIQAIEKAGALRVDRKTGAIIPVEVAWEHVVVRDKTRKSHDGLGYYIGQILAPRVKGEGTGYTAPSWLRYETNHPTRRTIEGGTVKGQKIKPIVPKAPPASRRIDVTIDAQLLAKLQASLGATPGDAKRPITLVLDAGDLTKREDGSRKAGVVRVESKTGAFGALAPINQKQEGPSPR